MPATTYTYRMPWGDTLRISANLVHADAPICIVAEDGTSTSTTYRTCDARHEERRMLRLVVSHLGREWYADPSSDASDEEQLTAAVEGAERA